MAPNQSSAVAKWAVVLLFAFIATVSGQAPANGTEHAHFPKRPLLYFIGDSLTEQADGRLEEVGWIPRLRSQYVRSADLLNRGMSGWNTRKFVTHALPTIENELMHHFKHTALIVLWLGTNDATTPDSFDKARHVPREEYSANLVKILTKLHEAVPTAKVLLLTPPPVHEEQLTKLQVETEKQLPTPLMRRNEETAKYAAACRDVVTAHPGATYLKLVDMYAHITGKYNTPEERGKLYRDGLHFSSDGAKEVFSLLKGEIESVLTVPVLEKRQIDDPK